MNNYTGNLIESTTLTDSLLSLKNNIFSTLNVAEVCKVTNANNQQGLVTVEVLRDSNIIECYTIENVHVRNNDLVLVLFTNTDCRTNIKRVQSGQSPQQSNEMEYHLRSYGVIIGRICETTQLTDSTKLMTAQTFINKAQAAVNADTLYCMGGIGQPLNESNKAYLINDSVGAWYNSQPDRLAKINAASASTFGFDCVCLIKGILWGWNANVNAIYGGATYASNGVPDLNPQQFLAHCGTSYSDFSAIPAGAYLWMEGHAGIYIGNGLGIECTPQWDDGVQITAVGNIGPVSGYNTRYWTKWARIPYIQY